MARSRTRSRARRTTPSRITAPLAESTVYDVGLNGGLVDSDDYLYRPLTGARGDNLPSFQHDRAVAIAKFLFRANPVGNRLVTLLSDFVLGEGVSLAFQNPDVETVVMRHWDDPYNDWERAQVDLFQTFVIFGELLVPLFPNAVNGHLRIGCQLPDNIEAVETDPENWRVVKQVRLRKTGDQAEGTAYSVVNVRETREELRAASNPALFWTRGNPFGSRGLSILYSIADLLDMLDQFLFSEVERAMLLKAFVWDVTVDDADDAVIASKVKDPNYQAPRPGAVRIHNHREHWEALSPALDTYDSWNGIKALRNHTGGALGIPEHWYAEGGDVNRATAAAMSEPTLKRMTQLQQEWRDVVTDVLQAQIDYAVLAGTLPETVPVFRDGQPVEGEMVAARDAVAINLPDLSPTDNQTAATTLQTLVGALTLAVDEGYLTHDLAAKLILNHVQTLGVEIDVAAEIEAARAEHQQRQDQAQQRVQAMYDANPPTQLQAMRGGRQDAPPGAPGAQQAAGGD